MYAPVLLGSQVPTFQVAPPCDSNAVGEVVDFMVQLGRPLDEAQQLVMGLWLGELGDGLWAAFQLFLWLQRQNGKSYPALARELSGLFLFGEQLILHTAHNSVAVMNQWKLTLEVIDANADLSRRLRRVNKKDGEEGLELMSGAELQFRVRSGRGKGRSLSGNCVVVDEALYLKPADLEAFGPTMLARANAQVIFTSTPPEDSESPIVAIREQAHEGAPRVAGAEWVTPAGADLDDPAVLARVNPAYGDRITAERMEDMRRLLGPDGFARECGGIWPNPATGKSIDPRRWADLHDAGSRRGEGASVLGVSIAPLRDVAAITVYGVRQDGLGHAQLLDFRPGTDWIVNRLVELLAVVDPALVAMTKTAAATLERLPEAGIKPPEKVDEPEHGDLMALAGPDVTAACGQIVDAVRQGSLRVVPAPDFDAAVAGAATRQAGDTITWARQGMGTEAAPLEALTVARYAHGRYAHLVQADDYDVLQSVY